MLMNALSIIGLLVAVAFLVCLVLVVLLAALLIYDNYCDEKRRAENAVVLYRECHLGYISFYESSVARYSIRRHYYYLGDRRHIGSITHTYQLTVY